MKGWQVVLGQLGAREIAALMIDGQLDDLFVTPDAPAVGTIYRAIADRPVKGQGGIFLKTPDGSAYLRGASGIAPGTELLVQVTGFAEPGKAIPVTQKILFKSRYVIVTPDAPGINVSRAIRDDDRKDNLRAIAHEIVDGRKTGLILRSSCAEGPDDEIAYDIASMVDVATPIMADQGSGAELLLDGDGPHALAWREWVGVGNVADEENALDHHGVIDAIATLSAADVALGNEATMFVETTRALTAVDVNTSVGTSGLAANIAAARALPRALRLRGIGGQITLDLAPMGKKDRRAFETAMRAAFKNDPVDTALAGWTPLGHFELQRKRERFPLPGGLI